MSESVHVKHAREMAHELVAREVTTGRDTGEAMRIASRKYGIPLSALWALRYRPPKDLFTRVYFSILAAYEANLADQKRKLEYETRAAEARGANQDLIRAARRLGGIDGDNGR